MLDPDVLPSFEPRPVLTALEESIPLVLVRGQAALLGQRA